MDWAIAMKNVHLFEEILNKERFDADMFSSSGDTLLHAACQNDLAGAVRILLERDASIDIEDSYGLTVQDLYLEGDFRGRGDIDRLRYLYSLSPQGKRQEDEGALGVVEDPSSAMRHSSHTTPPDPILCSPARPPRPTTSPIMFLDKFITAATRCSAEEGGVGVIKDPSSALRHSSPTTHSDPILCSPACPPRPTTSPINNKVKFINAATRCSAEEGALGVIKDPSSADDDLLGLLIFSVDFFRLTVSSVFIIRKATLCLVLWAESRRELQRPTAH